MKIFVGQIYIKPGVKFPFSIKFQQWLAENLSKRVQISSDFIGNFGDDFSLVIRLSADDEISSAIIKGPTIFKRDKDVEFTLFMPHENLNYYEKNVSSKLLEEILNSSIELFYRLKLDCKKLKEDVDEIRNEFLKNQGLVDDENL